MAKNKKWKRFRHKVFRKLIYLAIYPRIKFNYKLKVERFKNPQKRPHLIIMNHQTAFDQFFVGYTFPDLIYYVASEDLFSNGFVSKIINYAVRPIPIKKSTTDIRAVMTCMKVAKEGLSIAVAPEGNRTYSGVTEHIKPSIVKLIKALKMPLAIFIIEGGYGAHPRWSDVVRKGEMRSFVKRVIEYDEYKDLSDDELYELVKAELYVDETKTNVEFKHKKRAEFLERAYYVCPNCGFSSFRSDGDKVKCENCSIEVSYTSKLEFVGDEKFPFKNTNEWYRYQSQYVLDADLSKYCDKPLYKESVRLFSVKLYDSKKLLDKNAQIALFGDRYEIDCCKEKLVLKFSDISTVSVLGRNKLNIYYGEKLYQIKPPKRFNAVKYVNFYYKYKIANGEEKDVKFLGL